MTTIVTNNTSTTVVSNNSPGNIIKTVLGGQGKSAYAIALDNGFVGTEQQWLDSLGSGMTLSEFENNLQQTISNVTIDYGSIT